MIIEPEDKENWDMMKEMIKRTTGFDCKSYSDKFLQRRVQSRLLALRLSTYKDYIVVLRNDAKEHDALLKELTIHVTNFFRDKSMWEFLRDKVIPSIAASKTASGNNLVNVWSAGCSSGEETLSLAICFREALGPNLKGLRINILGTDYDSETIHKAKQGLYEKMQFKEMPEAYLDKYFIKIQEADNALYTTYSPIPALASMISYSVGDILLKDKPLHQDLILCRNTVIYFDIDSKSRLYDDFYDCLLPGGFLVLGKTEILQGQSKDKFKIFDMHERVYWKNDKE